jgi:hypothetical protein
MLNSLNTTSRNTNTNNKVNELLLDFNNKENENKLLLSENNEKETISTKDKVSISLVEEIPTRTENRIICFSRRRKCPKKLEDLTGYLVTLFFFVIFTILITICLSFAKTIPQLSESLKNIYNWILFFIWVTSITSVICLTDAAFADPGRQRGTPVSHKKFSKGKIRKIVGGQKYALKYCTTCHLIRDIRTFHCNTCGICIEKHDHHCNYLSNCVGVYNYKKFFIFVVVSCIHVSIIFFTCSHYILFCSGESSEGYEWIALLMTLIIVFAGFFEIFTVWMLIQHIITIVENRTTREFIKKKEYGIYNKGCRENCKEALCSNSIKEL